MIFKARSLSFSCILLLVGLLVLSSELTAAVGKSRPWPQEGSDLSPDPRLTFGTLENGVRYIVFPYNNPTGRISLRLSVAAGSLDEKDGEQGLAHFVEHMAFRGTRHFPAGELVAFLQRQGAGFGSDVSAHTERSSTVYLLDLASGSPASLRQGLEIFRDYTDGIIFEPAAVQTERGVVLAEARVRDTEQYRKKVAEINALFPRSPIAERSPIGRKEIIAGATPESLRLFYDCCYQPERMTVIVVGDIVAEAAQQQIAEIFGSLKPHGPARPDHPSTEISPNDRPEIFLHRDPNQRGVSLELEHVQARSNPIYNAAQFRGDLIARAARYILDERTEQIASKKDAAAGSFGSQHTVLEKIYDISIFGCGTSVAQWRAALGELGGVLRRAQTGGFTEAEVERQRVSLRSYYDDAVRTQARATSPAVADAITESLQANEVFLNPETQAKLAGEVAQ